MNGRARGGAWRGHWRAFLRGLLGKASARDPLGPEGEALAAKHLVALGYRVLGRNLRVRRGEADLLVLAPDRVTVVLVEVKSRRVPRGEEACFLPPEASVHAHKREKLRVVLRSLARANGWESRPMRIDVVAIEFKAETGAEIRHHVDAVSRAG